jgi:hypothetical protein
MFEPEFIDTASRAGSDWPDMSVVLLPVVVALIIACLAWLLGWTGRERRQDRDNRAIREGIYSVILHASAAARASFPDTGPPARQLVDAIESQLGPLLVICAGVSGRAKAIREALDLTRPLSPDKPAARTSPAPKVTLEEAAILVPGDARAPCEVREGFLVRPEDPPSPPREADMARDRRARLLDAVDDFHTYWSDRTARLAELEAVQRQLTEVRPPETPHDHGGGWKASHSAH